MIGEYPDGTPIVRYAVGFPRVDAKGAIDSMALYAGQGVGILRDIRPAAEIARTLTREAHEALKAAVDLSGLIPPDAD